MARRRRRNPARIFTLVALVIPHLGSAARAGPVVAVEASGGTKCPDVNDVEAALATQLGGGATRSGDGWRLVLRGPADGAIGARRRQLGVELRDSMGRSRLTRDIEAGTGDCQALAETVGLIVHRFFAELGWTSGRPLPPPARLGARPSSRTPDPAGATRLVLEAGAGVWTRQPGGGTGLVALRLERGMVHGSLALLAAAAPVSERRPDGEAVMTACCLALSAGPGWQRGPIRLHAGPLSLLCRESAWTRGIPVVREATGTTWALGIAAGASVRMGPVWRLGLAGWGARAALGDRFVVAGWGPVLAPPPLQAAALATVAYGFSP
jgi:hypothetical protein